MRSLEAMQWVGGYVRGMGSGMLGLVRRAVAFFQFEDAWDAAGYSCFIIGIPLMFLGTLAAPDVPALSLWAEEQEEGTIVAPGPKVCVTNDCTTVQCLTRNVGECESAPPEACRVGMLAQCKDCVCVPDGACGCYAQ